MSSTTEVNPTPQNNSDHASDPAKTSGSSPPTVEEQLWTMYGEAETLAEKLAALWAIADRFSNLVFAVTFEKDGTVKTRNVPVEDLKRQAFEGARVLTAIAEIFTDEWDAVSELVLPYLEVELSAGMGGGDFDLLAMNFDDIYQLRMARLPRRGTMAHVKAVKKLLQTATWQLENICLANDIEKPEPEEHSTETQAAEA